MTMNDTWGFKSYDQNWKPAPVLIRNLVDIASKGGNYLLNVGPTSEGLIPEPSVERLREVGRWMKVNGDAIYATQASPFKRLPWGRCTRKPDGANTTLYLHVFNWPNDERLVVPGLKNEVREAALLAGGTRLTASRTPEGVIVNVPATAPDPVSSTVVLRIAGEPEVEPVLLGQEPDGSIKLPASEAICHGGQIQYESGGGKDNLGYWTNPDDWAEWQFKVHRTGRFKVMAEIAAEGSGKFTVQAGGSTVTTAAPVTGSYTRFQTVEVGTMEIATPGKTSLQVRAVRDGWKPLNLKSLTLRPIE